MRSIAHALAFSRLSFCSSLFVLFFGVEVPFGLDADAGASALDALAATAAGGVVVRVSLVCTGACHPIAVCG